MTPQSFTAAGFVPPSEARKKIKLRNGQWLKAIMIGSDGDKDSGKTEFIMSIPGVGQMICLDRGFAPLEDNAEPPEARNPNWFVKVVPVPSDLGPGLQASQYIPYFTQTVQSWHAALQDPNSTAVALDGHSDLWELHLLADFGKTTGIYPQTRYKQPYSEHRSLINAAWDSGKIIVCTNKLKDEWADVILPDGTVKKDEKGETVRERTGNKLRQGFPDQDYLFNVQIRHLFIPSTTRQITGKDGKTRDFMMPKQWGIRILRCKHNRDLDGEELWGESCNFRGLVELIYPDVPLERWGF